MHFTKEPMQFLYLFSYLYTFIDIYLSRYLSLNSAEKSRSELHLEDKTKLVNFKKAMLCTLVIGHMLLSILQPEKLGCNEGTLLSQPSAK